MNTENDDERFVEMAQEGAAQVEHWFATGYKEKWHEVWREGRLAAEQGIPRESNPHFLKVWREVWGYGYDHYDPMPAVFRQADENLKNMPLRPMTSDDL